MTGCGRNDSPDSQDAVATIKHDGTTIEISRDDFEHALDLGRLQAYPSERTDGPRGAALADLVSAQWARLLASEHGIQPNAEQIDRLSADLKELRSSGDFAALSDSPFAGHIEIGSEGALKEMTDDDLRDRAERAYLETRLAQVGALRVDEIKQSQMRLRAETRCLDPTALTVFCKNGPPLFDSNGDYAN